MKILNRFTTLPVLFDMLTNKHITLLSPRYWEDRNDAYYLYRYKQAQELKTLLACCFTKHYERFHFWKVFANGSSGVCVQFDRERLFSAISKVQGIRRRGVKYLLIEENVNPPVKDWPFLKRKPYEHEKEYRIIYENKTEAREFLSIPIGFDCISKITVSPWLDETLARTTVNVIKKLVPPTVKVNRSHLLETERWKNCIQPNPTRSGVA